MIKMFCDRCGNEIELNEVYTEITSGSKRFDFPTQWEQWNGLKSLCEKCYNEVFSWIKDDTETHK